MNCRSVQAKLSAYLDGELPGREMLEMRGHINGCSACRHEEDELVNLKRLLGKTDEFVPDPDFEARLVAHVFSSDRSPVAPAWRAHVGMVSAAAVAAAAALIVASQLTAAEPPKRDPGYASEFVVDQAYYSGMDPLSGGAPIIPISYGSR